MCGHTQSLIHIISIYMYISIWNIITQMHQCIKYVVEEAQLAK